MTQAGDAYAALTLRLKLLFLLPFLVMQCRFVARPDVEFSPSLPWRCGIHKSHLYVRDVQEAVYPDLGLVAANAIHLGLTSSEKSEIEKKARECYEICELQKQQIRLKEENLKEKLALNEINGDLTKVAKEVNEIRADEKQCLDGHAARYFAATKSLNIIREKRLAVLFAELRKLPDPGLTKKSKPAGN